MKAININFSKPMAYQITTSKYNSLKMLSKWPNATLPKDSWQSLFLLSIWVTG